MKIFPWYNKLMYEAAVRHCFIWHVSVILRMKETTKFAGKFISSFFFSQIRKYKFRGCQHSYIFIDRIFQANKLLKRSFAKMQEQAVYSKHLLKWEIYRWQVCFQVNFIGFPHTINLWNRMCRNRYVHL